MRIRKGDLVYCNKRQLTSQVTRIRDSEATIEFVTGDKIKIKLKDIYYVDNQWRIND